MKERPRIFATADRYLSTIEDLNGGILYAVHDRNNLDLIQEDVAGSYPDILGDRLTKREGVIRSDGIYELSGSERDSAEKSLRDCRSGYITSGKLIRISDRTAEMLFSCNLPVYTDSGRAVWEIGGLDEAKKENGDHDFELATREKYLDGLKLRRYFGDSENIGEDMFKLSRFVLPPRYAVYSPDTVTQLKDPVRDHFVFMWASFLPQGDEFRSRLYKGKAADAGMLEGLYSRCCSLAKDFGCKSRLGTGTILGISTESQMRHFVYIEREGFQEIEGFYSKPPQRENEKTHMKTAVREYGSMPAAMQQRDVGPYAYAASSASPARETCTDVRTL